MLFWCLGSARNGGACALPFSQLTCGGWGTRQIAVEQPRPAAEHGFFGEAAGVAEAGFHEFFQAWVAGQWRRW
jgi:hypothetical protein